MMQNFYPKPVRGFMASVGLQPEIIVDFQYNPTQLSDKRAVNYATLNAPGLLIPIRQYTQGGDRTISFNVRIDGLFDDIDNKADNGVHIERDDNGSITPELNKYRAFLYPKTISYQRTGASYIWNNNWNRQQQPRPSLLARYANTQHFESPPLCLFGFGEDRVIYSIVTDISITELLFNAQLGPLRADVAVTLVELSPYESVNSNQ